MDVSTVLCPLSADPRSARALPSAIDASRILGAQLVLYRAVEDQHLVGRTNCNLTEILDAYSCLDPEGQADPPAVEVVVNPHAPQAIAERAQAASTAVVMATSTQPLLHPGYLGSAAEHVVRGAVNPVLLIGPRNTTRLADVDRVVAPCDGSTLSELILPDADAWQNRLHVPLWVVTSLASRSESRPATESNYVRRLASPLDAQWEVLHGQSPARAITEWAPSSLITVTTHGHGGLARFTIGSVAVGLTRHATGPVLVRRPSVGI